MTKCDWGTCNGVAVVIEGVYTYCSECYYRLFIL